MKQLDSQTLKQMLCGGACAIRESIEEINELNVFPVPDGDTGTNMSKTIDSGIAKISSLDSNELCEVAAGFSKGTLFGARGNSGVILSQFFAGLCASLEKEQKVGAQELANAYEAGVKRAYLAVAEPVEGTILTVLRESTEYAKTSINETSQIEDFLALNIEEAERSLARTKEILPALIEADVVDSGGAGYLCIVRGMYGALTGKEYDLSLTSPKSDTKEINYDLFTTESTLEYGYCTECLVRIQRAKCDPVSFDEKQFAATLELLGCNSIVSVKDGDVLKIHAHTMTPSDVLTLCQTVGEFLNIKIENMSLQHSENDQSKADEPASKKPASRYGIVTVATGEGMTSLFESLGADVVINGGQTGNPSAEQFLEAFEKINAQNIIVLPNNSNIYLTAQQACELWGKGNVSVIKTKTLPQGYAALAVYNSAEEDLQVQLDDMTSAKESVVSGEITVAIRDSHVNGVEVKEGEYIGILEGKIVACDTKEIFTALDLISKVEDLDEKELVTLFIGAGVSDERRTQMLDALEEEFEDLCFEVYIGDQEIYDYLISIE